MREEGRRRKEGMRGRRRENLPGSIEDIAALITSDPSGIIRSFQ
jgi:hypothetical protein